MIKAIIFDADGMVVMNPTKFSRCLEADFAIPVELTKDFFENEFQNCLIGKADLKEELEKYVEKWGWQKSVDDMLNYWFSVEDNPDERIVNFIGRIRDAGISCYLATNQEKYRTEYFKKAMGFGHLFDDIFSSAYIGFKKPDAGFFEYIMESLPNNLSKGEILFCDDDEGHIEGAKRFGFRVFPYKNFEDFRDVVLSNI